MPYVAIRETVADFPGWKPVSHARGTARKTSGAEGARRFRDADDPGETVILLEWSDLDEAGRSDARAPGNR